MEKKITYTDEAIQYIARLSNGGVRLAIQYMEKCLAYNENLTVENVVKALNIADYHQYMELTELLFCGARADMLKLLDSIYASGVDFKQFIKSYLQFILDVNKYIILDATDAFKYINIPKTKEYERWLKHQNEVGAIYKYNQLLQMLVKLDADIKYSQNVKCDVEAAMLMFEVKE